MKGARAFKMVGVRMPPDLKDSAQKAAEHDLRSMNDWFILAVKEKLDRDVKGKPQTAATVQGLSSHYS
jgi:hypothetical protein